MPPSARKGLVWVALAVAIAVPLGLAATSPYLAWRDPVYILAGLAGVVALALLLVQPLLAAGRLPGLTAPHSRRIHRVVGVGLVGAVLLHVGALWVTSPPDVVDALLFASPAPFSPWGVVAMWAVFAAALVAALRRRVRLRTNAWRLSHVTLAGLIVAGSVVHAILIVGTMEPVSKVILCGLVVVASARAFADALRRTRRVSGPDRP